MPGFISDSPVARGLIRIGDEAIVRADDAKLRDYFAADYVFPGPGGDLGFEELRAYFASLRAAFSNLRIVREQIIADGRFLAARNTFSGGFTDVFTSSPIGPVEPTGQHVDWEVINTSRYDRLPQLLDQARHNRDGVRRAPGKQRSITGMGRASRRLSEQTGNYSRWAIASPTYGAEPVDETGKMTRKMPVQRHKCSGVSGW